MHLDIVQVCSKGKKLLVTSRSSQRFVTLRNKINAREYSRQERKNPKHLVKAEYFTCCACSLKSVLPSKTSLAHPQIYHHPSVLSNPQQHSQIFPIQLKIALYTFMPDLYCDFAKSQLPKVGAKFLPAVNFNLVLILHSLQFLSLPWLRKAYKGTTSEFFLTFNEDYIQSLILTGNLPTTPYPTPTMVGVRCYTPNCPSAHRLSPEMLNVNQNHTRPAGWAPTLHHLLAAPISHASGPKHLQGTLKPVTTGKIWRDTGKLSPVTVFI